MFSKWWFPCLFNSSIVSKVIPRSSDPGSEVFFTALGFVGDLSVCPSEMSIQRSLEKELLPLKTLAVHSSLIYKHMQELCSASSVPGWQQINPVLEPSVY